VAETAAVEPDEDSLPLLFQEVTFDLTAWSEIVGPMARRRCWPRPPVRDAAALTQHLRTFLPTCGKRGGRKRSRGRDRRRPLRGRHRSVAKAKILCREHGEIPLVRKKSPNRPQRKADPWPNKRKKTRQRN